jgi:hypothetical protein
MMWKTSRTAAITRTAGIPSERNLWLSGADMGVVAMGVQEE